MRRPKWPQPIVAEAETSSASPSAWNSNRPKNDGMKEFYNDFIKGNQYSDCIKGNKLFMIPKVTTRIISLLTSDVKTWILVGVSIRVVDEALKCLKIVEDFGKRLKCDIGSNAGVGGWSTSVSSQHSSNKGANRIYGYPSDKNYGTRVIHGY